MQAAAPIKKQPLQTTSTAGFTLVEVVISMTLMALIFTAAFGSYFLGMDMIDDSREEVRVSQIIQSEIERLRTKNWGQLGLMASGETFDPDGEFVKQYSDKYNAYRYVILLTNQRSQQYLVAVRVTWTTQSGRTTVRWFNTIFTKGGLNDYYYRDI
jgi:uncharacterized protein (TIGR02598 family)